MEVADIVAYIGAAAWLPQIIGWAIKAFSAPKLRLIPDRSLSVGFTSFGPIFNLHIAFASERKDALLEELSVYLNHEAGDSRRLLWVGHAEGYQILGSDNSVQQTVKRELPPVALKVGTDALVEKLVRFQDHNFHEQQSIALSIASRKLIHERKIDTFDPQQFLSSTEIEDLYQVYEDFFWWRPGQYKLHFMIKSPNKTKLIEEIYAFKLGHDDIQRLKSNFDAIKRETRNLILANEKDFASEIVSWNWIEPKMARLI